MPFATQVLPRGLMRHRSRMAPFVALAAAALHLASAYAARPVDEVAHLLEQGKAALAAKHADDYLRQNPADVEMRFLRGVIATEQKDNAQAIRIFSALTREYPNLPEPYNNLAVLYAAEGQERKASEVLEQAIRTSPSYTTAYENLGDLYARMASDAYAKALQYDGSRQAIAPKLALITQIIPGGQVPSRPVEIGSPAASSTSTSRAAAARVAESRADRSEAPRSLPKLSPEPAPSAQPAPAAPPQALVASVAPVAPATASSPTPAAAEPAKVAKPAPLPAAVAAPDPRPAEAMQSAEPAQAPRAADVQIASAQPSSKAEPAPAQAESESSADKAKTAKVIEDIEASVNAWAQAWSNQDMSNYLAAYSDQFSPADGSSLTAWKDMRRQRIVGKQQIQVRLRQLHVAVDGERARASFRQDYDAGILKTTTRKTLTLRQENGAWRILTEVVGR